MSKKASVAKYFVRDVSSCSDISSGIQEISRGKGGYGVYWKFRQVGYVEFMRELRANQKLLCVETLSGKFYRFEQADLNKFNMVTN